MTDVESSIKLTGVDAALASRGVYSRRLASEPTGETIYGSKDLLLSYELRGEGKALIGGIFHSKAISAIAKFEQRLRGLPGWQAICERTANNSRGLCDHGMSFVQYIVPTQAFNPGSIMPSSLVLDGLGFDPVSSKTALLLVQRQGLAKLLLPEGYKFPAMGDEPRAEVLRSAFRFKVPCCTIEEPLAVRRSFGAALKSDWERFFKEVLVPELREGPPGELLNVWYDGTDIEGFEVKQALAGDYGLAVASGGYVLLYLFFHTRSILLSVLGPIIALISVPLTFVLCAVCFGTTTLSFANFLALFLIVGFGADVILVYTDFWEESAEYRQIPAERLAWTYERAIKSSVTTTGTTALAFFANLTSVIRALRQFGFFMGMCVMLAWVLTALIYAPLLVVNNRFSSRLCFNFVFRGRGPDLGTHEGPGLKVRAFATLARVLRRFRCCTFLLALVLCVVCLGTSLPKAQQSSDLPSIFPDGHNRNSGAKVRDLFASVGETFSAKFEEPDRHESICDETSFSPPDCPMFWCEAESLQTPSVEWEGNGTCSCYRRERPRDCGLAGTAQVVERFVGPPSLTLGQLSVDISQFVARGGEGVSFANLTLSDLSIMPPTLLQEWETGQVSLQDTVQVSTSATRDNFDTSSCGWEDICFCGGPSICKLDRNVWQRLAPVEIRPIRRLAPVWRVAPNKRTKVRVVFGVEVPTTVKMLAQVDPRDTWDFLPFFDMRQPWTQRNIHAFCSEMPATLRVVNIWCWMQDFRDFARQETSRFPCRAAEFDALTQRFINEGQSSTRGTRYLWVLGGQVKAMYVSMDVDVSKREDAARALARKAEWDAYLHGWNAKAFKSAQGAFHVSDLWVRAESASQLIMSTVSTIIILFVMSFAAMFIFTSSIALALYVTLATLGVVCGLTFFIVVISDWKIGLIEVIAIIYFIGYALDYSLHIAYKYSSHEAVDPQREPYVDLGNESTSIRAQRTSFALKSIGSSVLGSAATTAGASLFLVFCKLTIFKKLGAMCLAVTLVSVVIALGPLPAALMIFGPVHPGCARCRRRSKDCCWRTWTQRASPFSGRARE